MAGNSLVEGLAVSEAAEMEGVSPAVFVKVGGEVVVTTGIGLVRCKMGVEKGGVLSCKSSIFRSSCFSCLFRFSCSILIIPMLKVLVHCSLLGLWIFLHCGDKATSTLGRLAMHSFGESCIARVILFFKGNWCHDLLKIWATGRKRINGEYCRDERFVKTRGGQGARDLMLEPKSAHLKNSGISRSSIILTGVWARQCRNCQVNLIRNSVDSEFLPPPSLAHERFKVIELKLIYNHTFNTEPSNFQLRWALISCLHK
jgi:hypothetical protein